MSERIESDELAEAAVFLAHTTTDHELPPELERRLFAEGRAIASEARAATQKTTNRASALALDMDPEPIAPPAGRSWREWAAWSVAAACFAIAVFEWRATALERRAASEPPQLTVSTTTIPLANSEGKPVADVTWSDETHSGSLTVRELPALSAEARYQVWIERGDVRTPLGFFSCDPGCSGLRVPVAAPTPVGRGGRIEITVAGAPRVSDSDRFLGRGTLPGSESRP